MIMGIPLVPRNPAHLRLLELYCGIYHKSLVSVAWEYSCFAGTATASITQQYVILVVSVADSYSRPYSPNTLHLRHPPLVNVNGGIHI